MLAVVRFSGVSPFVLFRFSFVCFVSFLFQTTDLVHVSNTVNRIQGLYIIANPECLFSLCLNVIFNL